MSSVFAANGLGVFDSSLTQANGYGASGDGRVGRGADLASVNAATGNLVVQGQDEFLASIGLDSTLLRTYNSLGQTDGDNNDGWRLSVYRSLAIGTGTNPITRTSGDGHAAAFVWDATWNGTGAWVSAEGADANDVIKLVGSQYQYLEGGTGVVETYDSSGKLLTVKDANGNTLTYGYTGSLITSLTDQKGQVVNLEYSGNNLTDIKVHRLKPGVTSSTDSANLEDVIRVSYSYDSKNRLASVKVDLTPSNTSDAAVYTTTYSYLGSSKQVRKIAQSDGSSVSITYVSVAGLQRVWTLKDSLGHTTEFHYDTTNRKTLVTDPMGRVTAYTYDTANRLTRVDLPPVNGAAANIQYVYDAAGNVTQVTDAASRVVKYAYDTHNNLKQIWDSLGNMVERTYDSNDRMLTQTTYTTPGSTNFATTTAPSDPLITHYAYDSRTSDYRQNLRFVVTPEGRVTEFVYNSVGLQINSFRYLGSALYTGTDFSEATLAGWTSGKKGQSQRADTAYDLTGQIKTVTEWNAVSTDPANLGAGVNDGKQGIYRYIYDAAGRLLMSVDPRGTSSSVAGDAYVTSYSYDGLDRILTVLKGLVTATGTTAGVTETTTTLYDDPHRTTTVTTAAGSFATSTFSKSGELVKGVRYSAAAVSMNTTRYSYDLDDRLVMETDSTGLNTFYIYDEWGRRVGTVDPTGLLTETQYNNDNQIIKTIAYSGVVDTTQLVDADGKPVSFDLVSLRGGTRANGTPMLDLDAADTTVPGHGYRVQYATANITVNAVSAQLTLTDSDTTNLSSATITLIDHPDGASESLGLGSGAGGGRPDRDLQRRHLHLDLERCPAAQCVS